MTPPQRPSNPGDRYALRVLMLCIVSVFRYQAKFACIQYIVYAYMVYIEACFPSSAYMDCIKLFNRQCTYECVLIMQYTRREQDTTAAYLQILHLICHCQALLGPAVKLASCFLQADASLLQP